MPKARNMLRENRDRAADMVKRSLANHHISAVFAASEKAIAFQYRNRDGGSHYMLSVAWMPGHLFIGGDMGDITFTHYHALGTLDGAIDWFTRNTDVHYILSKTGKTQVVDREQTLNTIEVDKVDHLKEERSYRSPKEELQKIAKKYKDLIDDIEGSSDEEIPGCIHASGLYDDYYGSYDYEYGHVALVYAAQQALRAFHEQTETLTKKNVA